jgi:hypothetical protein
MARIGVLPTKTTVQLREPDGDAGTIPAATAASAGVMTARYVQMLEELYTRFQGGDAAAPVIIERAADTSHLLTKAEAKALLSAVPRAMDMTPALQVLRGEIAALQRDMTDNAQRLLAAPPSSGDVVDRVARDVLDGVIAGFENIDQRLREVEGVVHAIRSLAEIKGVEDAA